MALLAHRPRISPAAASELALRFYGLRAVARVLPGERDQNFLLDTDGGDRYVLKVANAREDHAFLEAQGEVLRRLAAAGAACPRVVPTATGELLAVTEPRPVANFVRLVTYVPGTLLADLRDRPDALFEDLGRQLGAVDAALAGMDLPALRRAFHWDLARGVAVVHERSWLVRDRPLRALVERIVADIDRTVSAGLVHLRRGIVHNDANDHNVVVEARDPRARHRRVAGIIDYGDLVHGWIVGEPAVASAYAMLEHPDPLAVTAAIVAGYHAVHPLTEAELAVVFPLALLRLCVSVCIAADQQAQAPGDAYLGVSQGPIARTLPSLATIPQTFAEARLRAACGFSPVPAGDRLGGWLQAQAPTAAAVLALDPRQEPAVVLDLGVESPLVRGDASENAEPRLTARIEARLREAGAVLGIGRYDEARLLYTSPLFAPPSASVPPPGRKVTAAPVHPSLAEHRTVHLGLDLFAPAGTSVHAPLPGIVHACADNHAPLDYGGVVILRHDTWEGEPFFTLYGHLAPGSIAHLAEGTRVGRGDQIAVLGTPAENGGWTPHLHVQVLTDLLGMGTDVAGVCRASERDTWRAFSPDPNLLLAIPALAVPTPSAGKGPLLAKRRASLGPSLRLSYDDPLLIVRGWMQYLFDETGRRYLDGYNNVPHVGHAHPLVVEAGARQMRLLNTNTRYLHPLVVRLAERLTATLPGPLDVCYFLNSASEANELALRLARAHTGARDTIVLDAAYHGHTTGLIDISPYKHAGPGGAGAPDWVHVVPLPDTYRHPTPRDAQGDSASDSLPHRTHAAARDDREAGRRYAQTVRRAIERMQAQGRPLAAFVAETCPSVGGQIMLPQGYLAEVYAAVRAAGGVCIADEVQTGYGRIGTHFWAFEAHDVVPDIVVAGKPMGNGHPLAAVVTTRAIAASFDNGMEFFSTFGGNPVSCAVGLAVLDVVEREQLQAHAFLVGQRLLAGLRDLATRHPLIGDVRGSGLFLGVELVRHRDTREPAGEEASGLVNRLRELGILLGTDGPHHNVLKIRPPMPFSEQNARTLLAALDAVLTANGRET